jgi:hypothetical protein
MGEMWDVVGPDRVWILVVGQAPVAPGTARGEQRISGFLLVLRRPIKGFHWWIYWRG